MIRVAINVRSAPVGLFKRISLFIFALLALTSCQAKSQKEELPVSESNESNESNVSVFQEVPQRTIVREFDIVADEYRDYMNSSGTYSFSYIGPKNVHIKVYDDGSFTADGLTVMRADGTAGSEYEFWCGSPSTHRAYFFNL